MFSNIYIFSAASGLLGGLGVCALISAGKGVDELGESIKKFVEKKLRNNNWTEEERKPFINNVKIVFPITLFALTVTVAMVFNSMVGFPAALIATGILILPLAIYGAHRFLQEPIEQAEELREAFLKKKK
jgi:flagellar biosynthesis protein FliR